VLDGEKKEGWGKRRKIAVPNCKFDRQLQGCARDAVAKPYAELPVHFFF
jgi:hypothetical protein